MDFLTGSGGEPWQRYGIRLISQSGDDLPTGFVIGSGPWDPTGRYGTSDRGSGDDRWAKTNRSITNTILASLRPDHTV